MSADTDPLTWLGDVLDAMTPAPWEVEDPGTVNESNEWDAESAPSYWTWEIAAGDEAILGGQEQDDPRANVAGLAALRNLAPVMRAVVEAAAPLDLLCDRIPEGAIKRADQQWPRCGECAPCRFNAALDACLAAVREEQQRHEDH